MPVVLASAVVLSAMISQPGRAQMAERQAQAGPRPGWPGSQGNGLIAFASERTGNSDIFTMYLDGELQTNMTANPAADGDAAWSTDGTQLAFISDRSGDPD